MSKKHIAFDDFSVDDHVYFMRSFSTADFDAFAEISGDRNPLHGDENYAANAGFGGTVVPLHLCAAPLSMIAGMLIPGEPALYLSHELRAVKPVLYDEDITYSARISSINRSHRIIVLDVIAIRGIEIVLDARMTVQAREEKWSGSAQHHVHNSNERQTALVTGAGGAIGSAVAEQLAKKGWDLLIQFRNSEESANRVGERCRNLGSQVTLLKSALDDPKELKSVIRKVTETDSLGAIVHAASPRVEDALDALVAVNYGALKEISEAALPAMLRRQRGCIVSIGSAAVSTAPPGWDNYAAAKSMSVNFLSGLQNRYGAHGLRGVVVAPGYVRTPFSDPYRPADADVLLPEEVAETVVDVIANGADRASYVALEVRDTRYGSYGFHVAGKSASTSTPANQPQIDTETVKSTGASEPSLTSFVRNFFHINSGTDLAEAGLGQTAGWDSLRHIELILAIERAYGVTFTSGEIEKTHNFQTLDSLWQQKMTRGV